MEISDIFKDLPLLESERLILRKITLEDAEDFFEYASDPQVALYMSWLPHQSLEETRRLIETYVECYKAGKIAPWGIQLKAINKFIGTIGYSNWQTAHNRAALSYSIARPYWGQGIISEAVRVIIDFGF